MLNRATAMIGAGILVASISTASCSAQNKPELRVWIGMHVSDLNDQPGAKALRVGLSDDDSDFWGTDDPLTLTLVLPEGEVVLDYGPQIGVYLTSSPISFLHEKPKAPSITGMSMPARFSTVQIPEQLPQLQDLCEELKFKLGSTYKELPIDTGELALAQAGEPVDGLILCELHSEDVEISLTFRKSDIEGKYFPEIHWHEQIISPEEQREILGY